jgi:hypothetical protein
MNLIHFRITHKTEDDLPRISQFIMSLSSPFIMVREEATRPHCHCVIQLVIKPEQFRRKFKVKFPEYEGNKDFIIQTKDDLEAQYRYVCKGKSKEEMPHVISKLKVEVGKIEEYHNAYWEQNDKLKKSCKKKSSVSFTQECYNELFLLNRKWSSGETDRKIIYDFVMKRMGSHEKVKCLDVNIVRRIVLGVHNALCPCVFAEEFYFQCFS